MGWRERDYARWTDEERRRFLGSTTLARAGSPSTRRASSGLVAPGVSFAVLASAALLAAGHLPRNHPLIPALNFKLPPLAHHPRTTPSADSRMRRCSSRISAPPTPARFRLGRT